ncbi:MAG: hypothetical protein MSH61_01725, partial [Bacteroidales bacterium]|nr:hypothetical protein [Bacteroidales bacterium]
MEVKEKSVPLQPASEKGCLELLRGGKKVLKKLEKKFAGYEKVRTFAVRAVQKTSIAENEKRSLTRLVRTSTSKYRNKNL